MGILPGLGPPFYGSSSRENKSRNGFAVVSRELNLCEGHALPDTISVRTIYIFAILEIAKQFRDSLTPWGIIFADPISALDSFSHEASENKLNYISEGFFRAMEEIKREGRKLSLAWISAHRGISLNEMADILAKTDVFMGAVFEACDKQAQVAS